MPQLIFLKTAFETRRKPIHGVSSFSSVKMRVSKAIFKKLASHIHNAYFIFKNISIYRFRHFVSPAASSITIFILTNSSRSRSAST